MTENIGIDNLTSITYYDENIPLMLTGASIWEMSYYNSLAEDASNFATFKART